MRYVACTGKASEKAATNMEGAHKLKRASYAVSTAGIVTGIILSAVIWYLYLLHTNSGALMKCMAFENHYYYDGVCYRQFSSVLDLDSCSARGGVYSYGFGCYYN